MCVVKNPNQVSVAKAARVDAYNYLLQVESSQCRRGLRECFTHAALLMEVGKGDGYKF